MNRFLWLLCSLVPISPIVQPRVGVVRGVVEKLQTLWPTLVQILTLDQGLKVFVIGWCRESLSVKCFDEWGLQVWGWAPSFGEILAVGPGVLKETPPRLVLVDRFVLVVWPGCVACVDRGKSAWFEGGKFLGVHKGSVFLRRGSAVWCVCYPLCGAVTPTVAHRVAVVPRAASSAIHGDCLFVYHPALNSTDVYWLDGTDTSRTIRGRVASRTGDVLVCTDGRKYRVQGGRPVLLKKSR